MRWSSLIGLYIKCTARHTVHFLLMLTSWEKYHVLLLHVLYVCISLTVSYQCLFDKTAHELFCTFFQETGKKQGIPAMSWLWLVCFFFCITGDTSQARK